MQRTHLCNRWTSAMANVATLISVEYDATEHRLSYRAVWIDDIERLDQRIGIRMYAPDASAAEAGQANDSGISHLKARISRMWRDFDTLRWSLDWPAVISSTQYLLWHEGAAELLDIAPHSAQLKNTEAFRNFVAHGADSQDLLIAVSCGATRRTFRELFEALVSSLSANNGKIAIVGDARLSQPTPEEDARARTLALRDTMLGRNWPNAAQLAQTLGPLAENATQYAARRRAERALFGVWSLKDNSFVHPDFQFDENLQPHPSMPALLAALAAIPGMGDEDDQGGWRRAFWLYGETSALSERALGDGQSDASRTPADVFQSNPNAVVALANAEATADINDYW